MALMRRAKRARHKDEHYASGMVDAAFYMLCAHTHGTERTQEHATDDPEAHLDADEAGCDCPIDVPVAYTRIGAQ